MFATASLAKRIERAEAGLILEGVRASTRRLPADHLIAHESNGGAGVFTEPGSPFNKVVGLGFDGVPPVTFFDQLERDFSDRKEPLRFELASLGEPAILRLLTRRGYQLIGLENVLGLELHAGTVRVLADDPGDVVVSQAAVAESALWIDTVTTGFLQPDVFDGPASDESIPRDVLERIFGDTVAASGFERYLARREGVVAGGASFRVQDRVAQLNGAATLPDHRRRGVQSALLRYRLAEAARRGCDVAVVTTQPGSKSQENVQRMGFALLYVRAILVKEPAG